MVTEPDVERRLTLTIERPVAGGRMLARDEGRVVLVSGAIPGERVVVRVELVSKKVVLASTIDVLDASPDRRTPLCDPACGGAAYAHVALERQRALKAEVVADAFRRIGRMALDAPVRVMASPDRGYRLRGRLHVQGRRAGFFVERTHRLCDAAPTAQFRDDTLAAVADLIDWLGDDAGACASIVVGENVEATERVLHLEPQEGRGRLLARRVESAPTLTGATGVTTIDRGRLVRIAGDGRVVDTTTTLCGPTDRLPPDVRWARTASSFFQGNRYLTGALLQQVLRHVRGPRVLDLYAGVGLFSVGLAARGMTVTAVEGDETSMADLELNAEPWTSTLTTWQAPVEVAVATTQPGAFETVVLDPPRTGASAEAVAGVIALEPSRLVYVSCDPATLARDAALLGAGGYRLESVEAFDLFPNTAHVETLAVFDKTVDR